MIEKHKQKLKSEGVTAEVRPAPPPGALPRRDLKPGINKPKEKLTKGMFVKVSKNCDSWKSQAHHSFCPPPVSRVTG